MRHGTHRRRGARGFSILEVLLSAGLISISVLGLATVLPATQGNVHRGGQNSKATTLAQEMLETIRNDTFSQLALYNGLNGQGADTRNPSNFPVDNPSPPVLGNPANFLGGSSLARWANDIGLMLKDGVGLTGGYGTVRVQSVAQDALSNSILNKVIVTVYWNETGVERKVQLTTLVSGI